MSKTLIRQIKLEWDHSYGIDKRSGWTVTINGCVVVQLSPLWVALWKGWKGYLYERRWQMECAREDGTRA